MTTYYDPYASSNDPAYSPQSGPEAGALVYQLKAMGYTDKQIAAMNAAQAQSAVSSSSSARASSSGVAPTWAQQQASAQDARDFAESARRWQEEYDYNKARGDQQMQLQQAQLELEKQKRIDALRGPDNYIGYWRASRGLPNNGGMPTWASAPTTAPSAAAKPAGGTILNLPQSTTTQSVYAAPAWASATDNGVTRGPLGYAGGMFGKGTVLGTLGGDVPVSLSDWAVKNLKK